MRGCAFGLRGRYRAVRRPREVFAPRAPRGRCHPFPSQRCHPCPSPRCRIFTILTLSDRMVDDPRLHRRSGPRRRRVPIRPEPIAILQPVRQHAKDFQRMVGRVGGEQQVSARRQRQRPHGTRFKEGERNALRQDSPDRTNLVPRQPLQAAIDAVMAANEASDIPDLSFKTCLLSIQSRVGRSKSSPEYAIRTCRA